MDNYKDKYDIIFSKLVEVFSKERELIKLDKEIDNNVDNINVCNDEVENLQNKIYNMRHNIFTNKHNKCLTRLMLVSLISGLLFISIVILELVSSIIWMVILYVISIVLAHYNLYVKKINDKKYIFSELDSSMEYSDLIKQLSNKREEIKDLENKYEDLVKEIDELYLEIESLYNNIYELIDDKNNQMDKDESLEMDVNIEEEYTVNRGLVRRRIKNFDKKINN